MSRWTKDQRYCTLCAAAVLVGFVALALYLSPESMSPISPPSQKAEQADQGTPGKKQSEGFWGKVTADPLVAFTGFLALATTILALATAILAYASFTGIALTRGEFLASHRPQLVIHAIRILEFDQSRPPDDQPLQVKFAVINAGTSAGRVTGSAVHLEYLPPTNRPYLPTLPKNDVIYLRCYNVGSSDNAIPVSSDPWGGLNHVNATKTGKILYFSGWVVYEDERGYARTTYFCRQFNRFAGSNVDGRFVPIDDPECEKTY
jgi:hypothetical protein